MRFKKFLLENMDWTPFIRPSPFGVKTKLFPYTISIMSVNHVLAFFVISQGENLVLNIEQNFFNWTQKVVAKIVSGVQIRKEVI